MEYLNEMKAVAGPIQEKFEKVVKEARVSHPLHYTKNCPAIKVKCECGKTQTIFIECIDVIRDMPGWKANAMKYIWRAGLKSEEGMTDKEKTIEDLRKAIFYVEDKIRMLENE